MLSVLGNVAVEEALELIEVRLTCLHLAGLQAVHLFHAHVAVFNPIRAHVAVRRADRGRLGPSACADSSPHWLVLGLGASAAA
jgi:hypothetical protein